MSLSTYFALCDYYDNPQVATDADTPHTNNKKEKFFHFVDTLPDTKKLYLPSYETVELATPKKLSQATIDDVVSYNAHSIKLKGGTVIPTKACKFIAYLRTFNDYTITIIYPKKYYNRSK